MFSAVNAAGNLGVVATVADGCDCSGVRKIGEDGG